MKAPKIVAIFDNNGETFDRYTVIDSDGNMFGYSENALGVDQYCGNLVDNYMFHSFGYSWRKYCDVNKCTRSVLKEQISVFNSEGNIGVQLQKYKWPKAIVNAYNNRIKKEIEQ